MTKNNSEQKPQRRYFKTYLQLVRNSVGSNMFRNFYVHTPDRGEFDALDDGDNSCVFFVSSVLVIFKKIAGVHGTVSSTIEDLKKSGWAEMDQSETGDVLVWEAQKFGNVWQKHIGFYMGNGRAISTSLKFKIPVEHSQTFDNSRKIIQIFRSASWDDQT